MDKRVGGDMKELKSCKDRILRSYLAWELTCKGNPKDPFFLDENLSCVCLRKARDSVFALAHPAAVGGVFLPHPSSCSWSSPPLSCQGGSVELIQLKVPHFFWFTHQPAQFSDLSSFTDIGDTRWCRQGRS